jgi:hypothetical protein
MVTEVQRTVEKPMCPVCLATALAIAAKVAFTGGVAAVAIKKLGGKNARQPLPPGLVFGSPKTNVEKENSK